MRFMHPLLLMMYIDSSRKFTIKVASEASHAFLSALLLSQTVP